MRRDRREGARATGACPRALSAKVGYSRWQPTTRRRRRVSIMAHGFSAVKEMYLDKYAEAFAKAGFASAL